MAACTNIDLRRAREARDLTRDQLSMLVNVSSDTIERWERGVSQPSPDDVDNIARATDQPHLWHDWMCTHYTSYARRHPSDGNNNGSLALSIMALYPEMQDVFDLRDQIERDAADGHIDSSGLKARFEQQIDEVLNCAMRVKCELLQHKDRREG